MSSEGKDILTCINLDESEL